MNVLSVVEHIDNVRVDRDITIIPSPDCRGYYDMTITQKYVVGDELDEGSVTFTMAKDEISILASNLLKYLK